MAAASLLALLDDIASILDDVALLTKAATKKTAGVLGDDLALNAQQVAGVRADREVPVVWAVAKGSFVNKAILVPTALAISAFAPWAVTPLLMIGGLFLCYEGFEKIAHRFGGRDEEDERHRRELVGALMDPSKDMVAIEREKIKGAIRTDFILSAEIIVIALGTVAHVPFMTRVAVLVGIALMMTVGVYGLVAAIVKLDDAGLRLSLRPEEMLQTIGRGILKTAPYLMKTLSIAGTAAMFLVGGSILTHGISKVHHLIEGWAERAGELPGIGIVGKALLPLLGDAVVGIVAGGIVFAIMALVHRVMPRRAPRTP